MSVINKMLRDLDKQQEHHHRGFVSFKPQRKSHLLLWVAVPLALLAGWCGQAWYMERFSIRTENAATEAEVQKGQVHPLAAAAELVPALRSLSSQSSTTQTSPELAAEQPITLQEVVAKRVSPEVAARLAQQNVAEPAAVAADEKNKLPSFATQPAVEQRVVQVQKVEAEIEAIPDHTISDEVQVARFDQAEDYSTGSEKALESDWNDTEAEVEKPRSLAIEKVQLSTEQQNALLQQKAQKAESNGNLNQAVSYWQQIRQAEPTSSHAYLELSRLAQIQRNDAEALQILEQAGLAGVQDPKISMALAAMALKQQDWAKALTYLQYEPDIYNYSDFYALKAAALQKTGQHAQAVQVFQHLARQQPDQARWWLGMALSYDALQQREQALVAYRQVAVNGSGLSASSLDYVKKRITALE